MMMRKNSTKTWGTLSIVIHWLSAVAIIGLFGLGIWMTDLSYTDDLYRTAPFIHKSIGLLLFFVTLFRLIWRFTGSPEPLPNHTNYEKLLARLMYVALYGLLFGVMFSGYLISTADGRPISVFNLFEVPALITDIPKQEDIAGFVHYYLACTVVGMSLLHALAAFKHHIIDKDVTLKRMLGRNNNLQS